MNVNDDVVYCCLRLGPLHQLHPGRSRSLVRHNDCLHDNPRSFVSLVEMLQRWKARATAFMLRRFTGFVGNFARSAKEGLPIYRISGGAGFLWVASFDSIGRGILRFVAVDPSASLPSSLPSDAGVTGLDVQPAGVERASTNLDVVARQEAEKAKADVEVARNEADTAKRDVQAAKAEIGRLSA